MAIGFRVQASEALFRALSQSWGLSFDSTVDLRFELGVLLAALLPGFCTEHAAPARFW